MSSPHWPPHRTDPLVVGVGRVVFVFLLAAFVTGSPVRGIIAAAIQTAVAVGLFMARADRRYDRARARLLQEARHHVHRRDRRIDRIIARQWPAPPDDRTRRSR